MIGTLPYGMRIVLFRCHMRSLLLSTSEMRNVLHFVLAYHKSAVGARSIALPLRLIAQDPHPPPPFAPFEQPPPPLPQLPQPPLPQPPLPQPPPFAPHELHAPPLLLLNSCC